MKKSYYDPSCVVLCFGVPAVIASFIGDGYIGNLLKKITLSFIQKGVAESSPYRTKFIEGFL